jgi:hypothetical protein
LVTSLPEVSLKKVNRECVPVRVKRVGIFLKLIARKSV